MISLAYTRIIGGDVEIMGRYQACCGRKTQKYLLKLDSLVNTVLSLEGWEHCEGGDQLGHYPHQLHLCVHLL